MFSWLLKASNSGLQALLVIYASITSTIIQQYGAWRCTEAYRTGIALGLARPAVRGRGDLRVCGTEQSTNVGYHPESKCGAHNGLAIIMLYLVFRSWDNLLRVNLTCPQSKV